MAKWADSLIRISNHEVETLQKRLADIVERRQTAEMKVAALDAEAEAEALRADGDIEAGWYMIGFRQGFKIRRDQALLDIDEALIEEAGARDALAVAFENLKKYEHVAEAAKVAMARKFGKLETAALDELGLRRAAVGGR
ncbi:MAG: flagellar export protein FliJ [Caulobacter sp.]|nr:flagellar export protein FliJ [Caulobacter sp.]